MMDTRSGPVVLEMDEDRPADPSQEAPILDIDPPDRRAVMAQVMALGARRSSKLTKWFWSLLVAFVGFVASLAAWDYVNALLARSPVLGTIATGLLALLLCVLAVIILREFAAIARLGRVDAIQRKAETALATADLSAAKAVSADLLSLYAGRAELQWGRARLAERESEIFDAEGVIALSERELLAPLDEAARREVEAAARSVATVTAMVPIALADLFTALAANIRMIRRIAEIYGGRAGAFGAWRLTKTVMTHLVATGMVAVGDDLIGSVAGGGLLSKVSRRFGEGVVNGALTARVGVAAIEVCRPLPFVALEPPRVSSLVSRAVTGLFSKD